MIIDAAEFDWIARDIFAQVYSVIAEQIIEKTGVASGTCLDVGCGSGHLGIALAQNTDLQVRLFDQSQKRLLIAAGNIAGSGLEGRVRTMLGNVRNMQVDDRSVDLVVSKGAVFFWEDRLKAFQEIYRVLSPGGCAYIGDGFGTPDLKRQITQHMLTRDKNWLAKFDASSGQQNIEMFHEELRCAGIPEYEIIWDSAGLWIYMKR